jgi:hypothetical protein
MIMNLRARIAILAAAIAVTGGLALTLTAPAQARFTCPAHSVCLFSNENFTGNVETIDATNPGSYNQWLDMAWKGSANVNTSASSVEFWSHLTGDHICVAPNTKVDLFHEYGYVYIDHNTLNCQGVPPGP